MSNHTCASVISTNVSAFKRLSLEPLNRPPQYPLHKQRYVVGWPELDVIKIGSTLRGRARWGTFLNRGGVMIDLACFDDSISAEVYLENIVSMFYNRAFDSKHEAKHILGNNGAGYLECFNVPLSDWGFIQKLAQEEV